VLYYSSKIDRFVYDPLGNANIQLDLWGCIRNSYRLALNAIQNTSTVSALDKPMHILGRGDARNFVLGKKKYLLLWAESGRARFGYIPR